jgi:predicted phage terminase large subunit-like protein
LIQPKTIEEYRALAMKLDKMDPGERYPLLRWLARTDLYFLLWWICGRKDIEHAWLLARCKEVQSAPDGYLDLWSRGHYKSSILTFGKTVQDILASHGTNPLPEWGGMEPTFGIFSHTRPIAKAFLTQIKREFETNSVLRNLFPDILWEKPESEAPKWSEDGGLIVKRKGNPKEATVEAWGLVEGMPTSKHYNVIIYDDIVTDKSVTTPEMMAKTIDAWALSLNLGSKNFKRRMIGTYYHGQDAYHEIEKRGVVKVRFYPGREGGVLDGNPVLQSEAWHQEAYLAMGPYIYSCQVLLNPVADSKMSFKKDWLRFHLGIQYLSGNKYITVDPASEKKKTSDYTAMMVIDLGADQNYKVADIVRDRLNLKERVDDLFRLHRKWRPLDVFYEQYAMQADISYIKERQARENYYFNITPVSSPVKKLDRITRLIPIFEQGRMYLPDSIFKTNYEGRLEDLIDIFINEEFLAFPVPAHDDMLDAMAWILDPNINVTWPLIEEEDDRRYQSRKTRGSSWAV